MFFADNPQLGTFTAIPVLQIGVSAAHSLQGGGFTGASFAHHRQGFLYDLSLKDRRRLRLQ